MLRNILKSGRHRIPIYSTDTGPTDLQVEPGGPLAETLLAFEVLAAVQRVLPYSTSLDDREILHRSVVPTYHFQKGLLRLPIPKLEKTCERYLKSQQPILSSDEYSKTEAITKQFLENEGAELHQLLVQKDKQNKHTSYISEPWFDMYLEYRDSIMLNHNPFMEFTDDPKPEYNDQLLRSTNMIVSALRFMKTLRAGILEPEVYHLDPSKSDNQRFRTFVRLLPESLSCYGAYWYKAFPLDMSQYNRLFNSTRIPRQKRDELFKDENAKHMLVLRNGHFYVFDVLDRDGNILPPEVVLANMKFILQDKHPAPSHSLAVMSSEKRDKWAAVREELLKDGNEKKINLIDTAMFAVCLDDDSPTDFTELARSYLHGNGTNRWFDKSFELIFKANGRGACNFEHAWGDGVAVLRMFNEVFKDSTEKPSVHPSTKPADVDGSQTVQRLDFNLSPKVQESITSAMKSFNDVTGSLDLHYLEYKNMNKPFVKKQKLSPDSLMQLAIQMGFYKQCGQTAATYESCSTAAFRHGRTETVRPATMATKKATEMLFESKSPPEEGEVRKALVECTNVHNQLTKEAAMGQGFDRHLFGLKNIAIKNGKLPAFYQDPSYSKLNHIILSTSTLSSPAAGLGGFGPVVPDGYGIGYGIQDDRLGFIISSYREKRNVHDFIDCIEASLNILHETLRDK